MIEERLFFSFFFFFLIVVSVSYTHLMPYFDFVVPTELPGVDPKILDPRDTYECACQWEEKAKDLACLLYTSGVGR